MREHVAGCSCGQLSLVAEGEPAHDVVAVTVGAFADPRFPQPVQSVYEARQHDWVVVPEPVEHDD